MVNNKIPIPPIISGPAGAARKAWEAVQEQRKSKTNEPLSTEDRYWELFREGQGRILSDAEKGEMEKLKDKFKIE